MPAIRILIIDDSALFRKSIKKILGPLDSEIILASDGQEGLDLALREHFDIVISDIEMPKINGIKLCQRLKNNPATQSVPVVMVSLFDSDSDIDKGFQAGAAAYISKHEIKNSLLETVENILSKSRFNRDRLILVVDDSSIVRHIVENGLAKAGFKVITAEDGKKALALLDTYRPDLIISDITMPCMNGFDFCEAVQSDPDLAMIPFIVMSAKTDRSYMQRMIQSGASAFICKPYNIDELVILIEKILSDQFLLLLKEKERLESERNSMVASITSLITALEARDKYTKGHSEAVGRIVSGMLSMTGASRKEIETVTMGGRLHDIGKIGVRDKILLKPGSLTAEEYSHIKQHPLIGIKILESIPSFSEVLPMVLSHHERLDGKGYPHGLKGDQIPLWARMTAVADIYDALTSDRPYRGKMTHDKALQIIEDARCTQLCPDCVDLFLKWNAKDNTAPDPMPCPTAVQRAALIG
ncbi:MAG: response regulator [Desulfobacterales bacterium]|uniref:Response regulator n=1 Tax=Candidatus Desulfatibia vada TaxID=2841696 RepID=A0A8J6P039_9BACT|nr:response regulator [Candidatus Desulfatibia vada]MBL6971007.1 response regulator [Desulfobacterales bacterium]